MDEARPPAIPGPCPFAIAAIGVPARRWVTRAELLQQLELAKEFLDTCPLDSSRCVASAASAAGLSLHHFLRLFHETYRVTPANYLTRRRMETAKRLLAGTMDVIEVAAEVGFENHSAFSRAFKKHTGLSPSTFRKQAR